ncbi:MAG: outer membrane protein transport protein [Xanthomonadaceae bacterium]|nr:outer membrane protein transport protein [Xanthomonadaceae bacterium]MDE1961441.1 outer membrane protein transport protein [Xanthomonadaceae bacterium]MDE2258372.1 outer membrane protein transport protein [Xanthomonadaceae bacterium]
MALIGVSATAFAITDTETNASIPFNLANPGARSMGMGGAFLGLADDATAAYTNPAGLTQLVTPEISAEARHTDYSLPYVNGGSASVNPFNGSGLNVSDANSSIDNLSFLSIVYPHDRWSFAFYRDELVNFHNDFATALGGEGINGFTGTSNCAPPLTSPCGYTAFPIAARANLKIVDYGVSAAWKASDSVSLGIGLSYYDFKIDTLITRSNSPTTFSGVPAGFPLNQQAQFGSDNDVGVNLGARFALSEHWSAGVTYRRGPKFSYEATSAKLSSITQNSDGTYTGAVTSPNVIVDLKNVRFKVPDEFGAGVSWHPTDALVINFDADYIQYSQLTDGIQSLFGLDAATVSMLSLPNGTELHLGGEYTFTQMAHPFSLRAGVWHDPRHSIEFKGDPGNNTAAATTATLFHGGQGAQTHYALGLGWAFSKFEIDGAADFADVTDTYSISAIYRF